ncbi:hypothetical protein BDW67DRAFT_157832 [Aspergillus spinulosporus]
MGRRNLLPGRNTAQHKLYLLLRLPVRLVNTLTYRYFARSLSSIQSFNQPNNHGNGNYPRSWQTSS